MNDQWTKLWDIVAAGAAAIHPTDSPNEVLLVWPDASFGSWKWKDNAWHAVDERNPCPGDIAARDAL